VKLFNNHNSNNEYKIAKTKEIFDATGAAKATKLVIEEYTETAFKLLDAINITSEKRALLKQFGMALMNRKV
jgi:geranylgeranyl diphosphate synthase type II